MFRSWPENLTYSNGPVAWWMPLTYQYYDVCFSNSPVIIHSDYVCWADVVSCSLFYISLGEGAWQVFCGKKKKGPGKSRALSSPCCHEVWLHNCACITSYHFTQRAIERAFMSFSILLQSAWSQQMNIIHQYTTQTGSCSLQQTSTFFWYGSNGITFFDVSPWTS